MKSKKEWNALAKKIEKETGCGIPQCFTCRKILTRGKWVEIEKTIYNESGNSLGGLWKQFCVRCSKGIKI